MKHIRTYEDYRFEKIKTESIKESVEMIDDIYRVRTVADIPQSVINSYVKKVKDTTGKDIRKVIGDVDIAEELLKYVITNNLNVEKIPGNALTGGAQTQPQVQPEQVQIEVQPEPEAQQEVPVEPATQVQPEVQPEPTPQSQGDFEEPNDEELPL